MSDICPDCGKHYEIGDWPFACAGLGHNTSYTYGDAQLHPSDKVSYMENAAGEIRFPGRNDRPIHPKYAAAGFVSKTADTIQQIKYLEKRTGTINEATNYYRNSAIADRDCGTYKK